MKVKFFYIIIFHFYITTTTTATTTATIQLLRSSSLSATEAAGLQIICLYNIHACAFCLRKPTLPPQS